MNEMKGEKKKKSISVKSFGITSMHVYGGNPWHSN